jgi:hypothetical protein
VSEQAAHPIWACDNDAIKAEYQRALDEAKKWQDWHARVDSEAERLSFERDRLHARVSGLEQAIERALSRLDQTADPLDVASHLRAALTDTCPEGEDCRICGANHTGPCLPGGIVP